MKKYILLSLLTFFLIFSCSKKEEEPTVIKVPEKPVVVADFPVQDFMWKTMNNFYFWQEDVPNLGDNRFTTNTDYATFLSKETNPQDFFYKICYKHKEIVGNEAAVDRFSFLSSNYKDLVQGFAGISKSNGLEFGLSRYTTGDGIYGFVRYIIPNSNAATKNIKRGDIFTAVNGTPLTISNYVELLFRDIDTYTLTLATIENNTVIENGEQVTLTKEENLNENPILVKKIITQNGLSIGYLLYNSFVANYDEQLNDVFGEFKTANIDELILDFRYNGGGRVSSAIQIASSVYGTKTEELFLKARYNNKVQATFTAGNGESNFFDTTINGSPINSLNLSRVYVITSSSTASASELVINGLEPYIDVIQIGIKTVGKNEFSNTFVDDQGNNNFYSPSREANINPNNQWAIQPLLGRNENADGFSDYTNGLLPDYELREDLANLGVLGEPTEPLLALTLNTIAGTTSKIDFTPIFPIDVMASSMLFKPMNNSMVMDGILKPILKTNKK